MTSRFNAMLAAITALLLVGLIPPGLELAASLLEAFDTLGALCTGYNIRAVTNTFFLGASVAFVATLLGCIIAVAIATSHGPVRLALKALFLAPIFAPSIMPAIGLIYLIGANGMLMQCELYGVTGVFLGALIFALPHATLQIQVGLTSFDARLLDVARSLGAGPFERIYSVVLPHLKPSLINGALIAFVLTVTDFGVPKLLGGSFPVLATEIYNQAIGSQNFAAAAFLSLWLLVPCLVAFYFAGRVKTHGQAQGARALVARDLGACTQAINVTACVIVAMQLATLVAVIYGAFVTFWPYVPELTLANFAFKNSTYGIAPWINSLVLATGVALLGTVISMTAGYLSVRTNASSTLKKCYEMIASVPLCVPGTVLGLGFAMAFSSMSIFDLPMFAMGLLIFNTLIHLYTVAHVTAQSTLKQIDPRYETVGQSLGVSFSSNLREVILPLSAAGIRDIFCYLFASAVTTISAVVFLYTPQTMPAAVAAIQMIDSGFISEGAAMSTLVFISALTVRLLALKLIK